jgi:hypothetical protein
MTRLRRNAPLIEQLLAVPGVTIAALQQAMCHLRIRQGRCARWRCPRPVEEGRTTCETHRQRANVAARKSRRKTEELRVIVREFLSGRQAAE